ncbi:M24 family metallopeptidase [Chloroflexota bacterium]
MSDPRAISLGEDFHRGKVAQIQAALDGLALDGLLLLNNNNVIYASGFYHTPSERPLGLYIPAVGEPTFYIPLLELENVQTSWVTDIRTYFEYPGEENPILWMVRECGAARLGIDQASYPLYQRITGQGTALTVTPLVEEMRWVKSPAEVDLVAQAALYADYCLQHVLDNAGAIIKDGGTELDILSACLAATNVIMQRDLGDSFDIYGGTVVGTVHSGPRAALPHGRPLERQPQVGETLIAGIGAIVGGYHAESGATFIIGEPTDDQMHCLNAAVACDTAAVETLRPGATCSQVNVAALGALRDAGLNDAIRHRIGHGMGLQGHEGPWLAPGDETILTPNMVFSSEPGIYRPGVDGYRTINSMVVTAGEARVVSRFLAEHPPTSRIIEI